ncbi:MAG TPA: ABC transporter ATP-binding protein [bacterium]|nr:ABC transporter ATP-binding protein [bacterium]
MTTNAIEVHDLVRRFGSFTAVDGISFAVEQGEVFGFLGPNGAGKTTAIKVLNGILAPTSGTCRVLGFELPRDNARLKQSIGYMSQKFSLYEDLTSRENLRFFGSVYSLKREVLGEAIESMVARFGLERFAAMQAKELPSGARQRLALACALLHDPGVLFLDEPTSGMDPTSRRQFWEHVHRLASAGKTVLVTTHYLDEAEYCNRLCLINQGRIIAEGTPAQVRSLSRATALTVVCSPLNRGLVALLSRPELGDTAIYGGSLRLVTPDPDSAQRAIPGLFEQANVRLDSVVRDAPTLEDVFVQLVRESNG